MKPLRIGLVLIGCATVASAHGRKPEFQDRTVYAPPVRRGSAANPNPAFAPPNFNNDPFSPRASAQTASTATSTYNYGYDKSGAHETGSKNAAVSNDRKAKSTPPPSPTAAATGAVDESDQALPGLDAKEAPTPDTPAGASAPAASTDGLQAPAPSDVHPTAK